MPEPTQVDLAIVGDGLAAWTAAYEVLRRGRRAMVIGSSVTPSAAACFPGGARRHHPVGPRPSYPDAMTRWGRESARALWETFREDGDAMARLATELGLSAAVERGGGFVLARTREEAQDLAEGEDLLREDGFSGEFLDHFLLEARFDVHGLTAGYWAVDDLSIDERALVEGLRARLRHREGPILALDWGSRAIVETAAGSVAAERLVVAVDDPRVLPGWAALPGLRGEAYSLAEHAVESAMALPCPARSWDGRVCWERSGACMTAAAPSSEGTLSLDWVKADTLPISRQVRWTTAASEDGLPMVGALPGRHAFLIHSGSGLGAACAVAGARWVVTAALEGRDETPPFLRAARFQAS